MQRKVNGPPGVTSGQAVQKMDTHETPPHVKTPKEEPQTTVQNRSRITPLIEEATMHPTTEHKNSGF